MALSDEQNAMLRLLAQGEQGYADIAALMGLKEDEVRAKVIGALAQLEAEGKPAPDIPPPIAGGARPAAEVDPPEPESVAPVPEDADPDEADEPAVAEAVAPQEPVVPVAPRAAGRPKADGAAGREGTKGSKTGGNAGREGTSGSTSRSDVPEKAPSEPGAAAAPASGAGSGRPASESRSRPPASAGSGGGRTITLPTGRGAWMLGGGIVAGIAVIVVVILLVSGGGGGDSSSAPLEGAATNAKSETGAGNETATGEGGNGTAAGQGGTKELTQAELTAVDGSEAKGLATFGRVKNKLALQVEATGLEPTAEGTNSYTIWLAQSPKRMLPLASTGVKGSGKGAGTIAAEFEVPVEVLAYLANGTFDQISITKTDNQRFEATIAEATKAKSTPTYTGEAIMRGTIIGPIIGLAKREEEESRGE